MTFCQMFLFMNVILVDLYAWIPIWFGYPQSSTYQHNEKLNQKEMQNMNDQVDSLKLIVRGSQLFIGLFMCLFMWIIYKLRQERINKIMQARIALDKLKKLKKQTWVENQNQDIEIRSNSKECPICMDEYENSSFVVQLKCHKNHIYHHTCLEKFLEMQITQRE